jgi:nitroimidazol reductase NimA-like FMN-containing flavoprotein (pyridoxamine 5'-phosphate oxidase superfamily)
MRIRSLNEAECGEVLAANRVGRLACTSNGQPYVVPIHFAYADNNLYVFSMPGKKIEWMRANPLVSVVVEEHGKRREWKSVVVDGRYEELPDRIGTKRQREHAWSLLSQHVNWWEPGALKPVTQPPSLAESSDHVFFRILIDRLSGREAREKG